MFFPQPVKHENRHPEFYSRPLYQTPTNLKTLQLTLKHYARYLFAQTESSFFFKQWILLCRYRRDGGISWSLWRFKEIIPPRDRFWADPFVVFENDKYYVFIEEFLYSKNQGHIACLTLEKDGSHSSPVTVLQRPYHLSYPFIFSHGHEYYMIPETAGNRTIELYKSTRFPHNWEFLTNLKEDVNATDTTLFHRDGIWWMFATIMENEGGNCLDELFLFYSADLFSNHWTAHSNNPIVSDVRSARPAGKIFVHNGNLYRPSQNNSKSYGFGMKINQIATLSETDYEEVCVNEIEPRWQRNLYGTHTINFTHGMTVIDALKRRPKYFS